MSAATVVMNAGSSSIKFSVFLTGQHDSELLVRGQIEGLRSAPRFTARDAQKQIIDQQQWPADTTLSHAQAADYLFQWLQSGSLQGHEITAVGHRVVHGGMQYASPVKITPSILADLEDLVPLAPLHQPHNLSTIRAIAANMPDVDQVACFDTAFHRGHADVEENFALPSELTDAGIRRYGFHGLSYEYIAMTLPNHDAQAADGNSVVAHLGNGASLCALRSGRSVATTMSFTPLDGLPMGTRCGAIDPGVLLYLMDQRGMNARSLERLLYYESGLRGVSGISHDMRVLLQSDSARAAAAVELFVYRASREIGSLTAALEGLDALIFTAGIGQNSAEIRGRICARLRWLGVQLDSQRNEQGGPLISSPDSDVAVWVIPTNEELMIARHTQRVLATDG
jgi:acetate kinase